jgi:integrase
MKLKLTAAAVADLALPPGKDDDIWWDDEIVGFGYRLRASSPATWVFQYRFRRQSRRMSAKASAVSASAARAWAKQAASKAALGQDPSPRSEPEPEAITVGEAVDLFVDRQRQRLRPRSLIELKRHVGVHARPLHDSPLIKVDRRAVAALLAKIGASNGPIAANNVRRDLSAFFAWCCREGLIDANPAAHTNRFPSKPREHILSNDEIKGIWKATVDADPYGALVRLLLLLGARRQELGGLRWTELDLDAGLITLPPERVKGGRAFVIPLSTAALTIFGKQPRTGDHVFGARGFTGWARAKSALDKRSGVTGWRLHDMRRVISTRLHEDLLQPPHLIESILGHRQPGIGAVYNRAQYLSERRRVLDMWSEHVLALVESRSAKVVPLRA